MELSKCELEMMDVFWNQDTPLSRKDLLDHQEEKSWKDSSVHILLNSLLKKGAIQKAGMVKRVKTLARTFEPAISREQYYARVIFSHKYQPSVFGVLKEIIHDHPLTAEDRVLLEALIKAQG